MITTTLSGIVSDATMYLRFVPAVIAIIIIVWNSVRTVGSFINPKEVFERYVEFFYDANARRLVKPGEPEKKRILWGQFSIYFVSPLLFGISLALIKPITRDLTETLLVVISLIDAVLFSVYGVFPSVLEKLRAEMGDAEKGREKHVITHIIKTIEETGNILNFEIMVSVMLIALCLIAELCAGIAKQYVWAHVLGSVIIYSLTLMLFFNLLIVLKRYSRVIENLMK